MILLRPVPFFFLLSVSTSDAFVPSHKLARHQHPVAPSSSSHTQLFEQSNNNNHNNNENDSWNPLKLLTGPYESNIPDEIKAEIYAAEANTEAAQDRGQRVAIYTVAAVTLVGCAFFNAFLTQLRDSIDPATNQAFRLETSEQFAWILATWPTQFLFLNKIGGGLCLLLGASAGLLAEAELDTRRLNAERIYEELVRRREAREQQDTKQSTNKQAKRKKKRKSTKESKRLGALAEVMESNSDQDSGDNQDTIKTTEPAATATVTPPQVSNEEQTPPDTSSSSTSSTIDKKDEGLFDQVKNFYNRADSMAASQALLLNKKLEDAGVLEKITDESGLRVVGKQQQQQQQQDDDETKESATVADETKSTPK